MTSTPGAQEVADSLALTLERQDSGGAPWCPPRDGAALRHWVIDRSASLGSGIRRVVRLARLMAIADGRDYTHFLYVRLVALRARHFQNVLATADRERRLPTGILVLSERGIQLQETTGLSGTEGYFEIDFAQMPRLAALLDFLHNALGFVPVADLLQPLLHASPRASPEDVARRLHAALNNWLRDRLQSANHILQAQRIRAFLKGRGNLVPEVIDDEAILLFWMALAGAPEPEIIDGFRLYRSVACAMLRYRQALRDAAVARHVEEATSFGTTEDRFWVDNVEQAETTIEPWRSPLGALTSLPASRVKWLTGKEQNRLQNLLGGPAAESENETGRDKTGRDETWRGGLASDERFDPAFWLTLLRADVFGSAQASIVARLRKHVTGPAAIHQAMAIVDGTAYTQAAAAYEDLRQQLRLECLAALASLMEVGAVEAVLFLSHFGGRSCVTSVTRNAALSCLAYGEYEGDADEALLALAIAPALQSAIADPGKIADSAARNLLREALAASRKVHRAGFRREDRTTGSLPAMQAGAPAALEVERELGRLTSILSRNAARTDFATDHDRFLITFQRLYGEEIRE